MHSKITTKLIWGIVGLSSVVVLMTSTALAGGIYLLSERGYKSMLASGAQSIIYDYLRLDQGKIFQTNRADGDTLGVMLRSRDLSAIIIDKQGEVLARYGVERDIAEREVEVDFVEQGVYKDIRIDGYGIFDTYTVPLKAKGEIYGWMRLMRQNSEVAILMEAIKVVALVVVPLSWMIAAIVAWVMGKQITRPLVALVSYLEKVKPEDNEQKIQDSVKMDYEVWVVSHALNKLLMRLRENIKRQQQISENISHEFKTPLTRIASNLAVGKVQEAKTEVLELGGNVDALLSLSIWEKTDEECDLVPIIKHLVKMLPDSMRVQLTMPKKLITPLPSAHAMIIWRNILDNAIKHSKKDGLVKVVAKEIDKQWVVEVSNLILTKSKVGHKIIERKYRSGGSAGHGIGMSIVADMCRLHDLRLEIADKENEFLVRISG